MNAKSIIIGLFASILFAMCMNAQDKMNVDNLGFYYKEWQAPKEPLNPVFFDFLGSIEIPPVMKGVLNAQKLINGFSIWGQHLANQVGNDDPHVVYVKETIGLPILKEVSPKKRVEEKKDEKTGRVTSLRYHWIEFTMSYEDNIRVVLNNTLLLNKSINKGTFTYTTREFETSKEAMQYWELNKDILREDITKSLAEKSITMATNTLSELYGFPSREKKYDIIKTINEKKHPENNILRQNSATLKLMLESMDGYTPLHEEDLAPIIEYFKEIPVRYSNPDSKADRNLRYVAYYNLCKIYAYLDEPSKMVQYANLIASNGYDPKDGERMIKLSMEIKKQLSLYYPYTKRRQFDPYKVH